MQLSLIFLINFYSFVIFPVFWNGLWSMVYWRSNYRPPFLSNHHSLLSFFFCVFLHQILKRRIYIDCPSLSLFFRFLRWRSKIATCHDSSDLIPVQVHLMLDTCLLQRIDTYVISTSYSEKPFFVDIYWCRPWSKIPT